MDKAVEQKPRTDWEAVERAYRAGVLSVREIATLHGLSHTAIGKRATKDGWVRDLQAKVKAKADSMVAKREVAKSVAIANVESERQLVEATAQIIANVRMSHRSDISRFRKLVLDMLSELEHETGSIDLFEELGEMLRSEDDKGQDKRNDIYRKVISSASRIDGLKKLSDTLKTLIGLEREAFGIADIAPSDNPLEMNEAARKARLAELQAKLHGSDS